MYRYEQATMWGNRLQTSRSSGGISGDRAEGGAHARMPEKVPREGISEPHVLCQRLHK
jgi:hypothetical protein